MFDTEKFIYLVEARECIWKTSHSDYGDKLSKMKAWEEIGAEMFPEIERNERRK